MVLYYDCWFHNPTFSLLLFARVSRARATGAYPWGTPGCRRRYFLLFNRKRERIIEAVLLVRAIDVQMPYCDFVFLHSADSACWKLAKGSRVKLQIYPANSIIYRTDLYGIPRRHNNHELDNPLNKKPNNITQFCKTFHGQPPHLRQISVSRFHHSIYIHLYIPLTSEPFPKITCYRTSRNNQHIIQHWSRDQNNNTRLARMSFSFFFSPQTFNDTHSAIQQIGQIINEAVPPEPARKPAKKPLPTKKPLQANKTSSLTAAVNGTTTTPAPTTTTEAPFMLTRPLLQSLIRRNVKGLVRLFNIEWRDALNVSIQIFNAGISLDFLYKRLERSEFPSCIYQMKCPPCVHR